MSTANEVVDVFDLVLIGSHFGEKTVTAAPYLVKANQAVRPRV